MNLVKIADMLKNASDQNLIQEIQNPSGSVPSYMVLSELERRKKLRGSLMNSEPQASVAEDMEREAAPAAAGIGSMGQPPAQGPGYVGGGEVRGYAAGDYVGDYEDDLPWEERMRKWREMTGFGRMAPQAPAQAPQAPQAPQVAAPAVAPAAAAPAPAASTKRSDSTLPPAAPRASAPAAAPNSMASYLEEMKGYRKELEGMYKNQADLYQKQYEDLKGAKDKDVSMALLTAGLGIMGGRSAYAAENIGQGALPAVQQYLGADRERQKEMQKMALGQGALGIESLRARMEATRGEGELGLKERAVGADELRARASMQQAGAIAGQTSAYRQAALDQRMMGLREKAIEALEKNMDFQSMNPQQQEAAIQRRMQMLAGNFSTSAGPTAPTYNPQTRSW